MTSYRPSRPMKAEDFPELDRSEGAPRFPDQIKAIVRKVIDGHQLDDREFLPSLKDLATRWGVNKTRTVAPALQELAEEGLLTARPGIGMQVGAHATLPTNFVVAVMEIPAESDASPPTQLAVPFPDAKTGWDWIYQIPRHTYNIAVNVVEVVTPDTFTRRYVTPRRPPADRAAQSSRPGSGSTPPAAGSPPAHPSDPGSSG